VIGVDGGVAVEQLLISSEDDPRRMTRFDLAPPRHFVFPAVLLLLSEEPSYGYELVKGLRSFRFGTVDRPAVYRALAQLEKDGLVESRSAQSKAGTARRVYRLTDDGGIALRRWMGVVKEERDGLDRVLRRYRASATPQALLVDAGVQSEVLSPPVIATLSASGGTPPATGLRVVPTPDGTPLARGTVNGTDVRRCTYHLLPDRSAVLIEARSSVGPITFGALGITGTISVQAVGGQVTADEAASAHLEIPVAELSSGNGLYDAELRRRVDATRFPVATLDLDRCLVAGSGEHLTLEGRIGFHGVSRTLQGQVAAAIPCPGRLAATGDQILDIRDFGVSSPTVLLFRIYPQVTVKLQVEAELASDEEDGGPER
jgi:PadR family transcriptional regulator, regulatory protein PadR